MVLNYAGIKRVEYHRLLEAGASSKHSPAELRNEDQQDRDSLLLTIDNFIKATKLKAIQ